MWRNLLLSEKNDDDIGRTKFCGSDRARSANMFSYVEFKSSSASSALISSSTERVALHVVTAAFHVG